MTDRTVDGYRLGDPRVPYWSDEYMYKKAAEQNLDVELATDTTLFLDIDSEEAFAYFEQQLAVYDSLDIVDYDYYVVRPSKSGLPKRHITVYLFEPLPLVERILLQAVLGSDRKRELLAYVGSKSGQEHPVVFFRPKEKAA